MKNSSIVKVRGDLKMEIVFKVKKEDLQKANNALLKDEIVSRASIAFKEAKSIGIDEDTYYFYISGIDEVCNKAKELMKDISEIAGEDIKKKVIEKIKDEEETAMSGFGSIFG
jgi:hypothetical protein